MKQAQALQLDQRLGQMYLILYESELLEEAQHGGAASLTCIITYSESIMVTLETLTGKGVPLCQI